MESVPYRAVVAVRLAVVVVVPVFRVIPAVSRAVLLAVEDLVAGMMGVVAEE